MSEHTLEQLAVLAAQGDMESFENLTKQACGHLFSFLRLLSVPESDLDTVAQDVVFQMYKTLKSFDPENPFLPWLRGIARHIVKNFWRSRERERKNIGAFKTYLARKYFSGRTPEPFMEHAVRLCVEKLRKNQKAIIKMRYFEGLKSNTIAESFGITPVTVRQRLSRIREALKNCLSVLYFSCNS